MNNPKTLKMLILAEAARIAELLEKIPEGEMKFCYGRNDKEFAELKVKMSELRRDTKSLEKYMYTYEGSRE